MRSPNDLMSIAGSKASARSGSPVGSTVAYSDRFSMASGSIGAGAQNQTAVVGATGVVQLTAQQLGVMGMEALDTVINFWEDALAAHYSPGGVPASLTTAEDSEFCREIQNLLEMSYTLQEQSELLFLDQRSVLFREEHSIDEAEEDGLGGGASGVGDDDDDRRSRKSVSILSRAGSDPNFDSAESFASALDQVADLREFEGFIETAYEEYPLFQSALKHHDEYTVPCRTIRSELVHCSSDTEYLAKLHCVRLAFQFLFKDPAVGQWICESGRQILTDLLCLSDKDTKEFLVGYEDMVNFLQDPSNWPIIQMELEQRNVKAMTFYDICLDFIILDSFRDLDAPPASVTAVVQNRWLSNGFKETVRPSSLSLSVYFTLILSLPPKALTTAVWSVLKAKKRMLKFPNGFMAHFYVISEQISPLMAWGFFGPNENLRDICHYFREQLLAFLADIYSFQKSRFTTIEDFSQDVLKHMETRVNNIAVKFSQ